MSASDDGADVSLSSPSARRLVLYVPSITGSTRDWDALVTRLRSTYELEATDFRSWPTCKSDRLRPWSRGALEDHARRIAIKVDQLQRMAADAGSPYSHIVLVGSSVGGLLVRWAWLWAHGAWGSERLEWADLTERIVLVASINRGVDPRRLGVWRLPALLFSPFGMAWRDAFMGNGFVSNLRIKWMQHSRNLQAGGSQPPSVVQLLGDHDGLVTREDSLDVEQFPTASHISIPCAKHADVLRLEGVPDSAARFNDLVRSLFGEVAASTPPDSRPTEADIVFLVHGIRAGVRGWPQNLERRLRTQPTTQTWRTISPTYGYFSALAFAMPWERRKKVRWFLDRYSQELAESPSARFHYVGHSNGTHVLGRALAEVPSIVFHNVYLASSVLPSNHPWVSAQRRGQVERVRHDFGVRDVPVGLLSRGLSRFSPDIGGAGHEGFMELEGAGWASQYSIAGGHPAALQENRLDNVAAWLGGSENKPVAPDQESKKLFALVSRSANVWVPVLVAALVGLLVAGLFLVVTQGGFVPWLLVSFVGLVVVAARYA